MLDRMVDRDPQQERNTVGGDHCGSDRPAKMVDEVASPWRNLGSLWRRVALVLRVQVTPLLALQPYASPAVQANTYRRRRKSVDYD